MATKSAAMSVPQAEEFVQRMTGDQQFRSQFFNAPSEDARRALLAELGLKCEFAQVQKVLAEKGQHFTETESELIAAAMLGHLSDESLEFISGGASTFVPFGATGVPPFGGTPPDQSPYNNPLFGPTGI